MDAKEYYLKKKKKNLAIIKKLEAEIAKIDCFFESDYFPEKRGRKPKTVKPTPIEKTVEKEEKKESFFGF